MAIDFDGIRRSYPLDAVVGKVAQLRRSGPNKVALCPFHPDKSPSLVLYKDETYHCFGCGAHGDVIDFVAGTQKVGISEAIQFLTGGQAPRLDQQDMERRRKERAHRDALQRKREENAIQEARARWARALPVNGAGNAYLERKNIAPYGARREGENLIVPIYDGNGVILSVQSIAPDGRKLFHAGAPVKGGTLTLGSAQDGPVIVAEGFATGATIQAATGHVVLIGFSKGALKDTALIAQARFPGRAIVIAADTNGIDAAHDAAEAVNGSVVVPDLQGADGTDFNDLAAHYGIEDVAAAFCAPVAPALPVFNPADWQGQKPHERQWRWDGFIPDFQATLLTGAGAAGKSLATQQMSTCVAMGVPFLGVATKQCPALYITCEDDLEELHRRQDSICAALGIRLEETRNRLFLLSLQGEIGNELATFDNEGKMTIAARYREIEQTCLTLGVRHVTIDNTAHTFAGNENDRHQVAAFVNLNNKLAQAIGGSVVMVGHPNKAGDSYSGSTAWENQVRSRLYLEVPKAGEGDDSAPVNPDMRVLRNEKANYSRRGSEVAFYWHNGAFILEEEAKENGWDAIGSTAQAAHDNAMFLRLLDDLSSQRRNVSHSPNAQNFAPKIMARMPSAKGLSKASLIGAMERLFALGMLSAEQELWIGKDRHPVFGLKKIECGKVREGHA